MKFPIPDRILLTLVSLAFLSALLWIVTPLLAFADYPLRTVPFIGGMICLAIGLWFLYRSYAEKHQLITRGIYRHVRHPMYLALLLYASRQALLLPNWVAGPSYLVAVAVLFTQRVGREESKTKRLIPGVW